MHTNDVVKGIYKQLGPFDYFSDKVEDDEME
jgi:hypothetical protein